MPERTESPKRRPGRPMGSKVVSNEVAKTLRISTEDDQALRTLAERWGCTESAAMRRLIRERTEAEGVG